jgi:hypothetical protein
MFKRGASTPRAAATRRSRARSCLRLPEDAAQCSHEGAPARGGQSGLKQQCLREPFLAGERGAALALITAGCCFKGTFVPTPTRGHLGNCRSIHCKHGDLRDYD